MSIEEALATLGPAPRLGYVEGGFDRAALRRREPDLFEALARDPACRGYALCGERVLLAIEGETFSPLFTPAALSSLPVTHSVFLGLDNGAARIAVGVDPASEEALKARDAVKLIDLRSIAIQGLVAPSHLAGLAEAKALLQWHVRHRFCANCGRLTRIAEAGWRRECEGCGAEHFPRTDPVVIMLALRGDRCLLGRGARFPAWSCLAGFVEPGESFEDAVRREVLEEAGIRCGKVSYFRSQPWPFPMSLMIGCFAEALSEELTVDHSELEDARWFSRDEVADMLLNRHPQGLQVPPPVAIAHHILRAFVEETAPVF
jgi:NAD+ diphosphatase